MAYMRVAFAFLCILGQQSALGARFEKRKEGCDDDSTKDFSDLQHYVKNDTSVERQGEMPFLKGKVKCAVVEHGLKRKNWLKLKAPCKCPDGHLLAGEQGVCMNYRTDSKGHADITNGRYFKPDSGLRDRNCVCEKQAMDDGLAWQSDDENDALTDDVDEPLLDDSDSQDPVQLAKQEEEWNYLKQDCGLQMPEPFAGKIGYYATLFHEGHEVKPARIICPKQKKLDKIKGRVCLRTPEEGPNAELGSHLGCVLPCPEESTADKIMSWFGKQKTVHMCVKDPQEL